MSAGLDTDAELVLWLTPDWDDPISWLAPLSAFVLGASADADVCLCLDASSGEIPLDVLYDLIADACGELTAGARFADLLLSDQPAPARPGLVPVDRPEDVLAALGVSASPAPRDPEALVAHARAAKAIVDRARARLDRWRFEAAPDPCDVPEPLVSVRIPTFGDVTDLMTRALPSVLHGTYRNIEVVVCSDGPQPHAREAVGSIADPRVRYLELPARPAYPDHFQAFWHTAGIHALNAALDECRGDYIAPLDHDDAFTIDHVPLLVEASRRARADFVYGQAMCEHRHGPWMTVGSEPLRKGVIAHGSALYSSRLRHMRYDPDCWLIDDPGDWNLWRRLSASGAKVLHVPAPVLMHFRERTMIEDDPRVDSHQLLGDVTIPAQDAAADLARTGAGRLLEITLPASGPTLAPVAAAAV